MHKKNKHTYHYHNHPLFLLRRPCCNLNRNYMCSRREAEKPQHYDHNNRLFESLCKDLHLVGCLLPLCYYQFIFCEILSKVRFCTTPCYCQSISKCYLRIALANLQNAIIFSTNSKYIDNTTTTNNNNTVYHNGTLQMCKTQRFSQ